jgi:hypothetical protein
MRAAQMVAYYGMGPSLLSYGAIPPQAYGGDTMSGLLSDPAFRSEIEAILERCRSEVTELLRRKAHCVESIRDRLMIDEQITGEQFVQLMHTLGESRELGGEVTYARRPPAALGTLRPLGRPAAPAAPNGNGEAGVAHEAEAGANGESHTPPPPGTQPPSSSPWARPRETPRDEN